MTTMVKSSHRRDDKPPRSKLPSKQKRSSRKLKDVVDSPEGQKLEDIEKTPAKQHAVHKIAKGITHVSN